MLLVRSFLFALFFYSVTLVALFVAIIAALAGRGPLTAVALWWARYFSWCAAVLLGIRVKVEGRVPVEPVLIAAKHQSMFETIELVVLLGSPVAVVKRELAQIPLWGWVARRYGVIPVDRAGGAPALRRMLKEAHEVATEGRAIVIFPEGTRVAPGGRPSLQPGFAGLYRGLGLPVVPVALDSGRLWPRHRFAKRSGIITFRFGKPIPPGLPRSEIEARVYAAINELEGED